MHLNEHLEGGHLQYVSDLTLQPLANSCLFVQLGQVCKEA